MQTKVRIGLGVTITIKRESHLMLAAIIRAGVNKITRDNSSRTTAITKFSNKPMASTSKTVIKVTFTKATNMPNKDTKITINSISRTSDHLPSSTNNTNNNTEFRPTKMSK